MAFIFAMIFVVAGMGYAEDEEASLETEAVPQSIGGQAGEAVQELGITAGEGFSAGAQKVVESSRKVAAEAKETLKTLQQQWDVLAKQLQEKTQQFQKELSQQWKDFNKSFNKQP